MSTRRDARDRWRDVVQRQRASGLSASAFCRRTGVSPWSFYSWRRRLRDEATFTEVKIASQREGPDLAIATRASEAVRPKQDEWARTEPGEATRPKKDDGATTDSGEAIRTKKDDIAVPVAGTAAGGIELRLPGRRCVVVRPGFDRRTLLELLHVLEDHSSRITGEPPGPRGRPVREARA